MITMHIVVNPNREFHAGGQKGVVTMYPEVGGSGVVELPTTKREPWTLTPPWVNNFVPIN